MKRSALSVALLMLIAAAVGCESGQLPVADKLAGTPVVTGENPAPPSDEPVPAPAPALAPTKKYQLKKVVTNIYDVSESGGGDRTQTTIFSYEDGFLTAIRQETSGDNLTDIYQKKFVFYYDDAGKLEKTVATHATKTDAGLKDQMTLSTLRYSYGSEGKLKDVVLQKQGQPDYKMTAQIQDSSLKFTKSVKNPNDGSWFSLEPDKKPLYKFNDKGLVTEIDTYAPLPLAQTFSYDASGMLKKVDDVPKFPTNTDDTPWSTYSVSYADGKAKNATFEYYSIANQNAKECVIVVASERNDTGLIKKETAKHTSSSCAGWEQSEDMTTVGERTFEWEEVAEEPVVPLFFVLFDTYGLFEPAAASYGQGFFYEREMTLLYLEQPKKLMGPNWPNQ